MKTQEWNFGEAVRCLTRGAWDTEPDKRQWTDAETGLPCLIRRGPHGALCGYVGVPDGHPAFERHYDYVDVDVHGGLTYADFCSESEHGICHVVEPGEPDRVWWLGFDCAHSGDFCPRYSHRNTYSYDEQYRDFAYVTEQVQGLARQLAQIGGSSIDSGQ